jgi:uncharacterized protein YcgI (DUF1989 family)
MKTMEMKVLCEKSLGGQRLATLHSGRAAKVELKKGDALSIVTSGGQCSDLSFRGLSQAITRERLGFEKYHAVKLSFRLETGDAIYDTNYQPVLKVIGSSQEFHDILWPGCSKTLYSFRYGKPRDGCRDLLRKLLHPRSDESLEVVSFFMQEDDNHSILPSRARPGDYVCLLCVRDADVGVTACPDEFLANTKPGEIGLRIAHNTLPRILKTA